MKLMMTREELEKVCQDLSDKFDYQVEQIMKLEKENAELKEQYVKNITDCDICDTYCNSQLTKAKEIIKDLLSCLYSVEYDRLSDLEKAEQFLKEVEGCSNSMHIK